MINYEIARAFTRVLLDKQSPNLDVVGVTPEEFDLLTGDAMWTPMDRPRVLNTFNRIMHASADAMGLERINLPAEWVAGQIMGLVSHLNLMAAVTWVAADIGSKTHTTEELMAGIPGPDPTSARQLLALITALYQDEPTTLVRTKYRDKIFLRLGKVTNVVAA